MVNWRSKNGWKAVLLFATVLTLASLAWARLSNRQVVIVRQRLQDADDNLLLVLQQTDTLGGQFLGRFTEGSKLSDDDITVLETWLTFDERFLQGHFGGLELRFERSLTARRACETALLLDNLQRAAGFCDLESSLLESLRLENPNMLIYYRRQLDNLASGARINLLMGEKGRAKERLTKASQLVGDSVIPPGDELDLAVVEPLFKLYKLATVIRDSATALQCRAPLIASLERLAINHPEIETFAGAPGGAKELLEEVLRQ
jgi:hypothetical protein